VRKANISKPLAYNLLSNVKLYEISFHIMYSPSPQI